MTEVEFSKLLSSLSDTAKVLNQESDSINTLLSRFEEKIHATNVGISAATDLDVLDGELRWMKLQGGAAREDYWGLAIWISRLGERPILECSRDERIAALNALPRLVEALRESAQSRVDSIKRAKSYVK